MTIIGIVTHPDNDTSTRDLCVEITTPGYDTYPVHIRLEGDDIPLVVGTNVEVEGDLHVLAAESGKTVYRPGTFASVQLAMRVTAYQMTEESPSSFDIY